MPSTAACLLVCCLASYASAALLNTCYALDLDVGQERGSWMPPAWGRSGRRARATPVVEFADGGQLRLVRGGAWDHLTIAWQEDAEGAIGRWSVEGEKASFWLEHGGVERDDVVLEAGQIHGTCGAWGDLLQRRGTLTIKQSRFGWMPFLPAPRKASFIVGTFTAKREEEVSDSS